MFGEYVLLRAEIASLGTLSANADSVEVVDWPGNFERAPRMTFIIRGEPAAADARR